MGIITNQIINVKWNSHNKKHYVNKGYIYTKMGDSFILNSIFDLYKGTELIVTCDYCGKELIKKLGFLLDYYCLKDINELINFNDISCKKCSHKKAKQTIVKKYGVENAFQLKEVKEKIKQTNLERYGVENARQNKNISEKIKQTNLERYGVECVSKNTIIKEKIKQTNLERYGVTCNLQSPNKKNIIQEKVKQTNLKRYGVEYPMQSELIRKKSQNTMLKKYNFNNSLQVPEIRKKIYITKYKNQSMPCSKNQKKIANLLNGEINYPIDLFFIDIALLDKMIYIEYDGGGHNLSVKLGYITKKDFDNKQRKRKYILQKKGWKLIRIISHKDKLYSDDLMIILINKAQQYLLETNHSWVEIDIDNNEYRCSQYVKKIK